MNEEIAPVFGKGSTTKIEKYGWTVKDTPGKWSTISKHVLQIHPAYQRHTIERKVLTLAAEWSWVACGAIIVGRRSDELWVVDGQHRVLAARKRSDITTLPCLVFETASTAQEARGFLDLNTSRKPVTSFDKFRASIVAGDEIAVYVQEVLTNLGITVSQRSDSPMELKSIASAIRIATNDKKVFEDTFSLLATMCADAPIKERVIEGLAYIRSIGGPFAPALAKRIEKVGVHALNDGAARASAYFKRGGAKVWANGMLEEINKGLHNKFSIAGK